MSVVTRTAETPKKPRGPVRKRKPDFVSLDGLLTVEQWAALPEVKPPYELINGVLVRKMVTTNEHDWATGKILSLCHAWSDSSGWRFFSQGAGTRIDSFNGFVPDVMGFPPDVPLQADATYNPPPFIVFEVLSRGTSRIDRTDKMRAYEHAGVHLYTIVDLRKRALEIRRLQNGAYSPPEVLRNDDVWQPAELPGLRVELARLWF